LQQRQWGGLKGGRGNDKHRNRDDAEMVVHNRLVISTFEIFSTPVITGYILFYLICLLHLPNSILMMENGGGCSAHESHTRNTSYHWHSKAHPNGTIALVSITTIIARVITISIIWLCRHICSLAFAHSDGGKYRSHEAHESMVCMQDGIQEHSQGGLLLPGYGSLLGFAHAKWTLGLSQGEPSPR